MGIRRHQEGFGTIEIVILLVVVAVVAGSGYFIYRTHQDRVKTPGVIHSATQSTSNPQSSASYFTIVEWRVRAPYSGSDLTYRIDASNPNLAWLSSQQLSNSDPSCKTVATNSGNDGSIGKYLPTDEMPSDPPINKTVQQFLSQDFAATDSATPNYAKIGSYYYIYSQGQTSCSTDAALVNQVNDDADNLVENLQAVPD